MFRHVFSHCHTVYSNTQLYQQKISPRAFYWTRDGLLFSHVIHFIDLNFLAAHIHSQKQTQNLQNNKSLKWGIKQKVARCDQSGRRKLFCLKIVFTPCCKLRRRRVCSVVCGCAGAVTKNRCDFSSLLAPSARELFNVFLFS